MFLVSNFQVSGMYVSSAKAFSKPIAESTFLGDLDDFYECCADHAWYCRNGVLPISVAADNLQYLAERWEIIDLYGQDVVQGVMAHAFESTEDEIDLPRDYAGQIVRQWEIADPRDRWKHTGEAPP